MIDWCQSLFRPRGQLLPEKSAPDPAATRAAMTISCRDTAAIPKVANAGIIVSHNGRDVQVMHEGTLVCAGGYHGEWMAGIIRELRGHHEPQEELLFHHVVQHCRPGTTIMEVGAFWAYYTNWYLGAVAKSKAVCVEPDVANMACGQENLALNGREAIWVHAAVGREPAVHVAEAVPHHPLDGLFQLVGRCPIEMLHIDAQGAELSFLESCASAAAEGLLRFVFVSTHHESISGSATTHEDCLRHLRTLGAVILAEFGVDESFSGDGLIVASLCVEDAQIHLPAVSRNTPAHSLFGGPSSATGQVSLAGTDLGPMLVYDGDQAVGRLPNEHDRSEKI